jgi:uncharacterized protein YajQ (UPF0234 family)
MSPSARPAENSEAGALAGSGRGGSEATQAKSAATARQTSSAGSFGMRAPVYNAATGTIPKDRAMPSFDVVSEIDRHELANAVDQANRELAQRFDFKGTEAKFVLEETTVTLSAPAEFQLKQMLDILKLRLSKRGIDVQCLDVKDAESNLAEARQQVVLKHGIDADTAKKMSRLIKDSKLKVQAQIQGEKLRVTGKQRDELQQVIALLRKAEVGVPLQFDNFRD